MTAETEKLNAILAKISEKRDIVELNREEIPLNRSFKAFFFPQAEELYRADGNSFIPPIPSDRECVYFGVRACDAASFDVLDRVFLKEPQDAYYKQKREKATIITLACENPAETCFCGTFDIDPSNPRGDITVWIDGNTLIWEARTEKGENLTKELAAAGLLEQGDIEQQKLEIREKIKQKVAKLPLSGLTLSDFEEKAKTTDIFSDGVWENLSFGCLGCGTCTFTCPTCHCYDMKDYDTGGGFLKFRCWDSCMFEGFTKMAHGNNRPTQLQRFRQRFLHKLSYFPTENNGIYACVGCGRCVKQCPSGLNIVKVMKALGKGASS